MEHRERREAEMHEEIRPEAQETETDRPEMSAEESGSDAPSYEPDASERDRRASLLDEGDAEQLRDRWERLQATFVDDPQEAVAEADSLVDEVIRRTTDRLASHRRMLEEQWARGDQATTEDLRQALQRYRSFFHRMLASDPAA